MDGKDGVRTLAVAVAVNVGVPDQQGWGALGDIHAGHWGSANHNARCSGAVSPRGPRPGVEGRFGGL